MQRAPKAIEPRCLVKSHLIEVKTGVLIRASLLAWKNQMQAAHAIMNWQLPIIKAFIQKSPKT